MVKIFVGRLPESITKERLSDMFGAFGKVVDSHVLKNFGFVHMAVKEEAEEAIRYCSFIYKLFYFGSLIIKYLW